MDTDILDKLRRADDPDHFECPPDFDWEREMARVEAVRLPLERVVGHSFEVDRDVQDASFFTELSHRTEPRRFPGQGNVVPTLLAVRFSAFGGFYTIWGNVPESPVTAGSIASIREILDSRGFAYVPGDCLEEPYTGPWKGHGIKTWGLRFFDYD